jgi:heat shock protein HslJ
MAIAALCFVGCSPSDTPAEPPDAAPVATGSEAEEPVMVEAAASPERTPDATELAGAWLLEDLGGRGVMDMVQTTIEFDGGSQVSGSGGCNRFTGSYAFTDGELSFGPLAGTKRMCPEAMMDQEDRFHRALGAIDRVVVDGPFLLIYTAGEERPLKFTRQDVVEL